MNIQVSASKLQLVIEAVSSLFVKHLEFWPLIKRAIQTDTKILLEQLKKFRSGILIILVKSTILPCGVIRLQDHIIAGMCVVLAAIISTIIKEKIKNNKSKKMTLGSILPRPLQIFQPGTLFSHVKANFPLGEVQRSTNQVCYFVDNLNLEFFQTVRFYYIENKADPVINRILFQFFNKEAFKIVKQKAYADFGMPICPPKCFIWKNIDRCTVKLNDKFCEIVGNIT